MARTPVSRAVVLIIAVYLFLEIHGGSHIGKQDFPRNEFECGEGTYINSSLLCSGVPNCPNGTDESKKECKTQVNESKNCILPEQPRNGRYMLGGCVPPSCQPTPGSAVDYAVLNYSCDPGFILSGLAQVFCSQQWLSAFPECVQKCGVYDHKESLGKIGESVRLPWVVGIFTRLGDTSAKFSSRCFGSLISENIVVTAAHCLWNLGLNEGADKRNFRIVVGDFNGTVKEEDDGHSYYEIDSIVFSPNFRGSVEYFSDDLALIILTKKILIDESIFPVCVDFSGLYDHDLIPGKEGLINGWGVGYASAIMQKYSLPITELTQCEEHAHDSFLFYLTYDKFCAGVKRQTALCSGDAGSGFATQFSDGRWYLSGILGISYQSSTDIKCGDGYKIFTRVSDHREFIHGLFKCVTNLSASELPSVSANTLCKNNEFQCNSKECLPREMLCDGRKHCPDGTDETFAECNDRRCSSSSFRCKYGACIDKEYVCNGEEDCADGSDEHLETCDQPPSSTTETESLQSNCELPSQPQHGVYNFLFTTRSGLSPGMQVPIHTVLNYTCGRGFQLHGSSIIVCRNGYGWFPKIPSCDPVSCPPLKSSSRDVECVLRGEDVDCRRNASKPGTRAIITCKREFETVPSRRKYEIMCLANGKWNKELETCTPICGLANPGGVTLLANSKPSEVAEFPWHVGLYRDVENDMIIAACGGSIVTRRIVVSAAHCFWENGKFDFKQYRIVAGKYHHDWHKPDAGMQILKIQDVKIDPNYRGVEAYYANDIAIVILEFGIDINNVVRPICLDFSTHYKKYFSVGKQGIVIGWGLTETQKQSDVLLVANLTYVSTEECENKTPSNFRNFITFDHFCAGGKDNTTVCRGDSGGGFAVKFPDGRYYLVGIVSTGPSEECGQYPYGTFTHMYEHLDFVSDYFLNYD